MEFYFELQPLLDRRHNTDSVVKRNSRSAFSIILVTLASFAGKQLVS
jgi:hypothetical protein